MLKCVKVIVEPQMKASFTPPPFQTCVTFFHLQYTKEDILKKVSNDFAYTMNAIDIQNSTGPH